MPKPAASSMEIVAAIQALSPGLFDRRAMQHVLYIAQMMHIGRYRKPLFDGLFVADSSGPVDSLSQHALEDMKGQTCRPAILWYGLTHKFFGITEHQETFVRETVRDLASFSDRKLYSVVTHSNSAWRRHHPVYGQRPKSLSNADILAEYKRHFPGKFDKGPLPIEEDDETRRTLGPNDALRDLTTDTSIRVARAICELSGWTISPLRLQRLLYITHMMYSGEHRKPLIRQSFTATSYGPLEPVSWKVFRLWGTKPIRDLWRYKRFGPILNPKMQQFIAEAYKELAPCTDAQLVSITHDSRSAWAHHYLPACGSDPDHAPRIDQSSVLAEYDSVYAPNADETACDERVKREPS